MWILSTPIQGCCDLSLCLTFADCEASTQAYQVVSEVGEGTYGVVLKCVHRQSGRLVAVKKFKETEDDEQVHVTYSLCGEALPVIDHTAFLKPRKLHRRL